MPAPQPLDPRHLRRRFDPALIPFETSEQADSSPDPVLGQSRAKTALEFGLAMKSGGYHIYVAGPTRTGKTHLVRSYLERLAGQAPAPPDWVYVNNFDQPDQPKALQLPPGGGKLLAREMQELIEGLRRRIPDLFEGENYAKRRENLVNGFQKERSRVFRELNEEARERGYNLRFDEGGIMVAPADENGEPLPEEKIREMNDEQREELRQKSDYLQTRVAESLRKVQAKEKDLQEDLAKLDRDMVQFSVETFLHSLLTKYADMPKVLEYLNRVKQDITENYGDFKKQEKSPVPFLPKEEPSFQRYRVNVFVDNSDAGGAPVVVEGNPTYPNLVGRIERQAQFGALVTDFTLLTPGALHQANGGYLVLPMLELLQMWVPWQGLKRALKKMEVVIEDAMEQMGFMATRSLKPEPIPLDLKVILVGDAQLYNLLYNHDQQFPKLFKVRAEMADRMDWEQEEVGAYISHLCDQARREKLLPLSRQALARLVEAGAEMTGDSERITLLLADVEDLVRESDHYARSADRALIGAGDVDQAVAARRRRSSMLEERMRQGVTRGFIQVRTQGREVGEINGLAVVGQGDYSFGISSRISASLGLGKEGVVAIDRESELSGPFHTKGVLILGGFLRNRFGGQGLLALTASLVFEQSYSMIDGDSASVAETLVLLSRLAGVPLRQDLAVTGSVSQQGQAQAIGGVNQKIEGFFRLCEQRGLSGTQGVVIPSSNVVNLMLHQDIVAAVEQGKFAIYAVESVEQALELFTGLPAGQRGEDGRFPPETVYGKAEEELMRLRELARQQGGKKED